MTKTNLFIIVPSLYGGGSERVVSTLINYIDQSTFEITLVLGNKVGEFVKDIPSNVKVIDLKKDRVRKAIIPIVKLLIKKKPDIAFSTLGHLNLLIALFRPFLPKRTKFIARESNTISVRNKDESYPRLFDLLFKTVYKNFDLVICQANSMKNDLANNYGFPSNKLVVINNPIDSQKIIKLSKSNHGFLLPKNKINLLCIGRLSHQKRMDHAIKLMPLLSDDFHLTIIGDGELKNELDLLVKRLNLSKRVSLLGFIENPYSIVNQSDYMISTSRYEGFPNVVLEANACGIPVIAYNYIGGIDEIIIDKVNGELVENGNIKRFAQVIINTVNINNYDKKYIKKMTKEKYEANVIVKKYEIEFIKCYNSN